MDIRNSGENFKNTSELSKDSFPAIKIENIGKINPTLNDSNNAPIKNKKIIKYNFFLSSALKKFIIGDIFIIFNKKKSLSNNSKYVYSLRHLHKKITTFLNKKISS